MNDNILIDMNTIDELRDMMGDEFIGELVETYCEETPQLLEQLRQALQAEDAVTFRRAAHSIKSSSASLGVMGLADLARDLEALGKEEQIAGSEPALERLESLYQQVQLALKAL